MEFGERPEDFTQMLLNNLAQTMGDYLINLGDIVFGSREEKLEFIKKYLQAIEHFPNVLHILGNHDLNLSPSFTPTQLIMEQSKFKYYMDEIKTDKYFKATTVYQGKKIIFSHLPLLSELLDDYDMNIHGHIHTVKSERKEENQFTDKHFLVSMEYQNLQPTRLSDIVSNPQKYRVLNLCGR